MGQDVWGNANGAKTECSYSLRRSCSEEFGCSTSSCCCLSCSSKGFSLMTDGRVDAITVGVYYHC